MISFLTVALAVMAPTGLNALDNSKIEQNTQGVVAEAGTYSLIMNPDAREGYSLDGTWNYLVDPYEIGYYSYRMTPNNDAATFFADKSFNSDKTDLVEYDFDTAPTLRVPETFIRDYEVQLAAEQETGTGAYRRGQRRLSFRVQLDGSRPEQNVCLSIPELNFSKLDRIPGLCGCTPWVLKDFRSPKRMLTGIQDDYNRKGLVSDQGQKKNAFGVVQKWYSEK